MTSLKVTMVSHACLKIEGEFGGLVCDPWILNEPIFNFTTWKYPQATMTPQQVLEGMTYLFITHGHEDHFHIPSLDYFPRDFCILLPEYVDHPGLRAQTIERTLRAMGFHNIKKIKPWTPFLLGGKTPFTVIPAAKTRAHDWENSGFVLEHADCRLINMNDNILDSELAAQIHKRFDAFDIGFIQSVGVSMYPGCFKMTPDEMHHEAQNRKVNFTNQSFMIEPLKVKYLVPHAADFCWLDEQYDDYNWANRSTPLLFLDSFTRACPPTANTTPLIMLPGDTWSPSTGLDSNHPPINWDRYLDDIDQLKEKFAPKIEAIRQWLTSSSCHTLKERTASFLALTQKWLCQDYVQFKACVKIQIEASLDESSPSFHFYASATPSNGFNLTWEEPWAPDQTLFIRPHIWASILTGKIPWGMVQWSAKHQQHTPYHIDIGRFYFWMEYYIDLMNRSPQIMIEDHAHPQLTQKEKINPQKGVFYEPSRLSSQRC